MSSAKRERLTPRQVVVDAAIAFGLAGLSLVAVVGGAPDVGAREPLSIALLLLESLPLIVRRRWPIPVLAVTVSATIAHVWLAGPGGVSEGLGSLVALYTVAAHYDRRISGPAALIVAAAFATVIVVGGGLPEALQGLIATEVIVLIAWGLGDLERTRRLYAAAVDDRARLLEVEREERDRRAVQEERERIARELHDIVTHHVSVIVIQAGAGLTAIDRRPEQARGALEAIDRTGRQALSDMRRMLGILGAVGAAEDAASAREPVPGLDRLGMLLEEVRSAGLPVELSMTGSRRPLDAGVELTAYRIVQEALTNALKHARGGHAHVDLRYDERVLAITITDKAGSGGHDLGDGGSGGYGLIGLRERVALFGGVFEAGPTPTGFRVFASLPLETESPIVPAAMT